MTRRKDQFEAEFKPGDMSQMNEIMSMTTCFQTCMSEFMNCPQYQRRIDDYQTSNTFVFNVGLRHNGSGP